jgi:hypothetical protein
MTTDGGAVFYGYQACDAAGKLFSLHVYNTAVIG